MDLTVLNKCYLMTASIARASNDSDSLSMLGVSNQMADLFVSADAASLSRLVHTKFCLFRPKRITLNPELGVVGRQMAKENIRNLVVSYLLSWREIASESPHQARLVFGLQEREARILEGATAIELSQLNSESFISFVPRFSTADVEEQLAASHADYDIPAARWSTLLAAS